MSATDGSGEPRASGDEQASDASGGLPHFSPEQIDHLMLIAQQTQALTQSTPQQQRVLGGGGLGGFGGAFSSGSPLIPPPGQPPDGYAGLFSSARTAAPPKHAPQSLYAATTKQPNRTPDA